jgi:hypothetical protein
MKIKILFLSLFVIAFVARAQDANSLQYGKLVATEDLKEYLNIIASDALEGRETGTRGQKMAAAFIAAHFQELGLSGPVNGSYYQPVELYSSAVSEAYVTAGQTKFDNYGGVVYLGSTDSKGEITIPVVFAGNGTEADFNQVDVKDKAVFYFTKETRLTNSKTVTMAREKAPNLLLFVIPKM